MSAVAGVVAAKVAYASTAWDLKAMALTAAALGVGAALYATYLWWRAKATWSWRPVEGQITHSQTEVWETYRRGALWRRKVPIYRPDIAYVYTVSGTDYEGKTIFYGDGAWHDSHDDVTAIIGRYPPGQKVRVYAHPTSPKRAVLERGQQKGTLRHLALAMKLAAGALAFWVLSQVLA